MQLEPFGLERIQSLYENTVEYNLTETGVHPLTLKEILSRDEIESLTDVRIGYGQTNGSIELREAVAAMYPGADRNNILITNGSIEANLVAMLTLLEPGRELVLMLPNYMQIWGLGRALGARIKPFYLQEDLNWQPDLEELERLVTPQTGMIAVCNPNNPTGAVLTAEAMDVIVGLAEKAGAWLYADEIYRGAELTGRDITPSFHGRYEKTMVAGGLSKAYSLPGLRIGWLAGPHREIAECWAKRDYVTISTGVLSNHIAAIALRPDRRSVILDRNRTMLRENLAAFDQWARPHRDIFRYRPPEAGGFVFLSYTMEINSTELSDKLRQEESVFIIPGDCFGLDRRLRIGIGSPKDYLLAGLKRMDAVLERMK